MSAWLAPAILSVFGGYQGYESGKAMEDQAREMEKIAEENALLESRELQEEIRRQADEDRRLRSAALARAAASGATVTGSVAEYLQYMEDEQARQLSWLETSGASQIRLNLRAAEAEADALRIQADTQKYGSLIEGFVTGFTFLNQGGFFAKPQSEWSWYAGLIR